jgi:hypothetical protein
VNNTQNIRELRFDSDYFNTDDLCNYIIISLDFDCGIESIFDETAQVFRTLQDFPINEQNKILNIIEQFKQRY